MTRTLITIGVVVALILVILQEYFLILVVASLLFVSNVLSKTPPENLRYELSSHGLSIGDRIYYWPEMKRFFFFDQGGLTTLAIDMIAGPPSRLFVTINNSDKEGMKQVISKRLHFIEAPPETVFDRTYKSIVGKFDPLVK